MKWAAEGDENSKYFHSVVRKRSRKRALLGLLVDRIWCDDPQKTKARVKEYF